MNCRVVAAVPRGVCAPDKPAARAACRLQAALVLLVFTRYRMFDFGDLSEGEESPNVGRPDLVTLQAVQFRPGEIVRGWFLRKQWCLATVEQDNGDGTYTVAWNDGGKTDCLKHSDELRPAQCRQAEGGQDAECQRHDWEWLHHLERLAVSLPQKRIQTASCEDAGHHGEQEPEGQVAPLELAPAVAARTMADRGAADDASTPAAPPAMQRRAPGGPSAEPAPTLTDSCALPMKPGSRAAGHGSPSAEPAASRGGMPARAAPAAAADGHATGGSRASQAPGGAASMLPLVAGSEGAWCGGEPPSMENGPTLSQSGTPSGASPPLQSNDTCIENHKLSPESQGSRDVDVSPKFAAGIRVQITHLSDHPQMNGLTGTLIEQKWDGHWIVDVDDGSGKKRRLRRRWLIHCRNLKGTVVPEMHAFSANTRPKIEYFVVGTWDDWKPHRMLWDSGRHCLHATVKITGSGFESFQIWVDRDCTRCVHPDTADAGAYVPWDLCGPDSNGHGKHWTLGREHGTGARFEVRLFLWEDESPRAVEWERAGAGG